jgi:hypothetical protein
VYVSDGDGDGYVSYRKSEQRVSCSKLTTGDEEETKYMVEVEVEPRLTRPATPIPGPPIGSFRSPWTTTRSAPQILPSLRRALRLANYPISREKFSSFMLKRCPVRSVKLSSRSPRRSYGTSMNGNGTQLMMPDTICTPIRMALTTK